MFGVFVCLPDVNARWIAWLWTSLLFSEIFLMLFHRIKEGRFRQDKRESTKLSNMEELRLILNRRYEFSLIERTIRMLDITLYF